MFSDVQLKGGDHRKIYRTELRIKLSKFCSFPGSESGGFCETEIENRAGAGAFTWRCDCRSVHDRTNLVVEIANE